MQQKTNYKDTLNLPRTNFAMKANLQQKEPLIQKSWEKENLFGKIREKSRDREKFLFHDGPPYANGPIHLGHLLNKVLKDLVVRSKIMEGFDVGFVPGWDCHGLPIEHKVLKELGEDATAMPALSIRRSCGKYAAKYVKMQSKQMIRLGTLADYKKPYLTMTPDYEAGVLEAFSQLLEKGLVYRDLKPVHWSIENRTALAEAELEYHEREDKSVYVLFEIDDPATLPPSLNAQQAESVSLMIWTTTPWTLPANLAVAVAPKGRYGLYRSPEGENLIIGEALCEEVFEKSGRKDYEKAGFCLGEELYQQGVSCKHPFIERKSVVATADYVTFSTGTGCVHTAPGHGDEDYRTGLQEGLDIYCPVREDGTFDDTVPEWLRGKGVWESNELITQKLAEAGNLFHSEPYVHSYPHDWRSKTPTIFRATDQWFIHMDKPFGEAGKTLREIAIDAVGKKVDFYPDWGRSRLGGMLESRPDWCISRQRSWGLPLPYFTNQEGRAVMTVKMVVAVAEKIREKGSDVWFFSEPNQLLDNYDPLDDPEAPDWLKSKEDLKGLLKGGDVFDVWFESGSSWNSVLNARDLGYPADMYLEGSDQHRGWFQSSLLVALGATGEPPFRALFTHGFMVDARGRKMSKSGGNAIEVEDILSKYGADICRWWVSSLSYSNDIKVDWEFFDIAADEYRKIRNTIRFLLGNLSDFDPVQDSIEFEEEDMCSIDHWAYCEFTRFANETADAYSGFGYKQASDLIFSFCCDEMSAVYLACIKDRLYCERKDSRKRRRAQTVMYQVAEGIIKFLAPILVHTSFEAYKSLKKDDNANVHLETFPRVEKVEADKTWNDVMDIRKLCLKALEDARGKGGINNPLDAALSVTVNKDLFDDIKKFEPELEDLCGVSRFEVFTGEEIHVELADLSEEPRCERSWKRGRTVKKRPNGRFLSERDASALGL